MASVENPFGPGGPEENPLELEQPLTNGEVPAEIIEMIDAGGLMDQEGNIEFGASEEIEEINVVPFDGNLAEYMEETELMNISNDLLGGIEEDKSSRRGWPPLRRPNNLNPKNLNQKQQRKVRLPALLPVPLCC